MIYSEDFKGIDRMKRLIGLVIVALVLLAACGGNNDKKVTIGVASNDTKAWEKVKELAKKDDIDVEIKQFLRLQFTE